MNRLLPLIICALFSSALPAADREREQRWADEVADSVMTGDVEFLNAGGHDFLALYTPAATQPVKGAVIVVHGIGVHPNWPDVIYPLRTLLPEHGWATLSVQMPVLAADAGGNAYFPELDGADARLHAALEFLQEQGFKRVVVAAHSLGALMVTHWLSQAQPAGIAGFAGIGMPVSNVSNGPNDNLPAYLGGVHLPVLDLYGSNDLAGVLADVPLRAAAAQAASPAVTQIMIPGADHFFRGRETELVQAVSRWLDGLLP